jgi:hypothetical protein
MPSRPDPESFWSSGQTLGVPRQGRLAEPSGALSAKAPYLKNIAKTFAIIFRKRLSFFKTGILSAISQPTNGNVLNAISNSLIFKTIYRHYFYVDIEGECKTAVNHLKFRVNLDIRVNCVVISGHIIPSGAQYMS